jgi:carbonic anhydrase/acetyltransferase-like protein (isoleucine patch superfamily)
MAIEAFGDLVPRVHPEAWVHPSASLLADVQLGPRVSVWPGVVLRGDQGGIVIGADTNLQDLTVAHATGGISTVRIGARVTVGHRAILHGCVVEDDCLVGMGSILLDNCHVEPWCLIGAGTVVPPGMRIPTGSLVLGSPARVVRPLRDKDREGIRTGCRTYLELAAKYRDAPR